MSVPASRRCTFGICLALAAAVGSGCSSPPANNRVGDVSGAVTYLGKPVTAGTVTVHVEGEPVSGDIDSDGTYRLSGLTPGAYAVTVKTSDAKGLALPPKAMWTDGKPPKGTKIYVATPGKYERKETSDLKCTVLSTPVTFDIVLKD